MDNIVMNKPLTPPNSNNIGNQSKKDPPEENDPPADNGDNNGSDNGSNYITDVVTEDVNPAVTITGKVSIATGGYAPPNISINDATVSASGDLDHDCSQAVNGSDLNYTCVLQNTFTGTIAVTGVTSVKLFASMTLHKYTNQTTSLTGQDFALFKSSKSCSGAPPHQLDTL